MKTFSKIILILFFFVSCTIFNKNEEEIPDPVYPEGNFTTSDSLIFNKLNEYRTSKNFSKLTISKKIWVIANTNSISMSKEEKPFNHDGFAERADEIKKVMGSSGQGKVGENLALVTITSTSSVVAYWLESTTHRQNVEGDYLYIGISAVKDKTDKYHYITALFYK